MNMKSCCIIFLTASMGMSLWAAEPVNLDSQKDRISYWIGMDIGRSITNRGVDVNPEAVGAGIRAVVTGAQPLLNEQQVREAMTAFQTNMQARQAERMRQQTERNKQVGEKNKAEGATFLAENKKKEGVKTTPSGLQYKIITEGSGPKPTAGDTVVTHYRGTLMDGKTEFDSSYKRGEPATFGVTNVIKGWSEALQMMPVGSKWQLFIPPDLAYGERQASPTIPPNSTLLFDLELIGIQQKTNKVETPK